MPAWQLSLSGAEFAPDSATHDAYRRALRNLVATIAAGGAAPDAVLLAVPGEPACPAQVPARTRPEPPVTAAAPAADAPPARSSAPRTGTDTARHAARTACPSCGEPVRPRTERAGSSPLCARHPAPHGLRLAREATHALQSTLDEALAFASSTAQTWRACAERWERPSPQLAALAADFAREAERRAERIRRQLRARAQS